MSVMIVNDVVFVKVFNSLVFNGGNWILKMVVDRYEVSGVMKELQKLHEANYKSYDALYKLETPIKELIIADRDYTKCENLCQLLKYLQFIHYQIESNENLFDYSFINYAINRVQTAIIDSLQDYQNAAWG